MAQILGVSKSYYAQLENGTRAISTTVEAKVRKQFFVKKSNQAKLEVSFDWVSLHFRTTEIDELLRKVLRLSLSEFMMEDYARYQYKKLYKYGNINVYVDDKDETHGALIECSGMACREMEQLLEEQKRDWYDLFETCDEFGNFLRQRYELSSRDSELSEKARYFNVTRLDLALDEPYSENGNFKLAHLLEQFRAGLIVTPKKEYSNQSGGRYTKEGLRDDGQTIYIGSPKSSPYFRFYEKDAERAKALGTTIGSIHDLYGFKNRFEIVLRHEKSDEFIQDYLRKYFDIATEAVKIINSNLVVFEDFKGHLDAGWYDLMNSYEAYQFKTQAKAFDIEKTWAWAIKNLAGTMKLLQSDDPEKFQDIIQEAQLSKRHEAYLDLKNKKKEQEQKNETRNS